MKVLLTLPLLTSCSAIRLSAVGPGFATLALGGALVLFFFLVIKPNQDGKNERKRKAAAEAESRRNAEKAFVGLSPLRDNEPSRGYENHFAETELMSSTL